MASSIVNIASESSRTPRISDITQNVLTPSSTSSGISRNITLPPIQTPSS
jgi:hypothetical protein